MKTHIIYIPGLGDRYDGFRRVVLSFWKLWGVSMEYVPITWYDEGSFDEKMQRIERAVKRAKDRRIVLVGESAGASLALHGASRFGVKKVITLCGVAQSKTPISNYLRAKAPALHTAASTLPSRYPVPVESLRAFKDGVVGERWSKTNDATVHTIWMVGHMTTIVICLTILASLMVTIAKK